MPALLEDTVIVDANSGSRGPGSQTLGRGIRILEILAEAREPLTIDALAKQLGVHRSIAYRLLRTLEDHRLVVRDASGRLALGARMAALAAGVGADLHSQALPELTSLANELGMTCFLVVLDAHECITLASVEPRHAMASVAQRPGSRHPVTIGAPGKAILSALPATEWPPGVSDRLRLEIADTARRGFATSHDEVIPTVQAVAVPLVTRGRAPAALTAIHVRDGSVPADTAARLMESALAIRVALDG
jgi:DNA-binding IclR family transcriptional regulator